MTWVAPDVERSEDYPARRNEPEREMLRGWLDWHRGHECGRRVCWFGHGWQCD